MWWLYQQELDIRRCSSRSYAHCITLVCRILFLAVHMQVPVPILVHVSSVIRPHLWTCRHMVAEARFAPVWKNWYACLETRQEAARVRLAGSLSVPAIRDCALCREWFPLNDNGQDVELQRKEAAFYMWLVGQLFRRDGWKVSPRDGIDLLRVFECLCSHLGVAPGFHASQLTPFEYMSLKQLLWLERYKQHQLARQSGSSRRRAERFKYIQDLDQNADVEACD